MKKEEDEQQICDEGMEDKTDADIIETVKPKKKRVVKPPVVLDAWYDRYGIDTDTNPPTSFYQIGVDEVGRGPLFGRVYTAAVVLPTPLNENEENGFQYNLMKDSKKFHSAKKINEVAEYIKENAVAWCVTYKSEEVIDSINIRQSVLSSMHDSISGCVKKVNEIVEDAKKDLFLLVDGNDFKSYIYLNDEDVLQTLPHTCIEGGDNKYCAIAAASILAKVERDRYIEELCSENPDLDEKYGLLNNKGYGTKKHIDGIKEYGITKWHRKSYGICSRY
jgi:ribonuclease HII